MAVSRRECFFLTGSLLLAAPAAGHADSYYGEEFTAKKQQKEKLEQLRKQGGGAAGPDEDDKVEGAVVASEDAEESGEEKGQKLSATSTMDEYKGVKAVKDADPLKTALVTVLRVQESTLQESRLITTGNFKDLQRNKIKMAMRMMIENSGIKDVIVKASGYATDPSKVSEANEKGRAAVQDLIVVLDYFNEREVKVTDLSVERKEFVVRALKAAHEKLDEFLAYMPKEKVKAARDQVILEDELNMKEMPKDLEILNPVFMN